MSRVITFSRVFPKYHPKAGKDTFFVEKILNGIMPKQQNGVIDLNTLPEGVNAIVNDFVLLCTPEDIKGHTIRASNRWKVGDKFSPRVWLGKPYRSKQITIAPDIEIKKIWDFNFNTAVFLDESKVLINGENINKETFIELAKNDGLAPMDLLEWFGDGHAMSTKRKDFKGQIIAWQENINY